MIREEIQIVRRRLDDYASYKALALEADRQALETQVLIDNLGSPQSPSWGTIPAQNHLEMSTRLNALISEQMQYDRDAKHYRTRIRHIEEYISDNFDGLVERIMRLHYMEGVPFDELEDELGYSASGLKNIVYRAMEACPFQNAVAIL